MRKFYKTTYTIEVLSEEPLAEGLSLYAIDHRITYGDCSGLFKKTNEKTVSPKQMTKLLVEQGSSPSFFSLGHLGSTNRQ